LLEQFLDKELGLLSTAIYSLLVFFFGFRERSIFSCQLLPGELWFQRG